MRSTTKRLEHLEKLHRTHFEEQRIDAERLLTERLDLVAAKMRASGYWPPEPRPTVEEMKEHLKALFAGREAGP
jgi:hypothetical protein